MEPKIPSVIVIGGGLSGLCAAQKLIGHGVNVVVLEARNRVGGRTYTIRNDKVKWADLGGTFVGPTQDHVLKLAKELGIETYKLQVDMDDSDNVHYVNGKHYRYKTFWPSYGISNPFAWLDILYVFSKLDKLAKEVNQEDPWNSPNASELDGTSLASFLKSTCSTKYGLQFCMAVNKLSFAAHPAQFSLLWAVWYIKCCGGVKRMFAVENGGQERKLYGGAMSLSEALAHRIGDKLHLSSKVYRVTQHENGVKVFTTLGHKYEADYVVMATPLSLQMKIHYDPPLPLLRNQLIQRAPLNCVFKALVYYNLPFWERKELSSFVLVSDENICLNFVATDTYPECLYSTLVIYVFGEKASKLHSFDKEERKNKLTFDLSILYGCDEALYPVHYEDMDWSSEQYSGGCYGSAFPPGAFSHFSKILREPFRRIHFAGTETATLWPGYMNGAVQSGERACREVLLSLGITPKFKDTAKYPEFLPLGSTFFEQYPISVRTAIILATSCVVLPFIPILGNYIKNFQASNI